MINSGPETSEALALEDEKVRRIVGAGSAGAVTVAAIATAIVIAIWIAFYLLVFFPRAAP